MAVDNGYRANVLQLTAITDQGSVLTFPLDLESGRRLDVRVSLNRGRQVLASDFLAVSLKDIAWGRARFGMENRCRLIGFCVCHRQSFVSMSKSNTYIPSQSIW